MTSYPQLELKYVVPNLMFTGFDTLVDHATFANEKTSKFNILKRQKIYWGRQLRELEVRINISELNPTCFLVKFSRYP